jgi:hypothetical protein
MGGSRKRCTFLGITISMRITREWVQRISLVVRNVDASVEGSNEVLKISALRRYPFPSASVHRSPKTDTSRLKEDR